jgi:hypothetical protein
MNTTAQRTRDAWLALRCQTGEAAAFRELVTEMERPLLYFATKLLGDEDGAPSTSEDLAASISTVRPDEPSTAGPGYTRSSVFGDRSPGASGLRFSG